MAVWPTAATPIANPAMPCSDRGVLNTLSTPYFSSSPLVHRKTPPNFTSSPNTIALNRIAITWDLRLVPHRWLSLWTGTSSCALGEGQPKYPWRRWSEEPSWFPAASYRTWTSFWDTISCDYNMLYNRLFQLRLNANQDWACIMIFACVFVSCAT